MDYIQEWECDFVYQTTTVQIKPKATWQHRSKNETAILSIKQWPFKLSPMPHDNSTTPKHLMGPGESQAYATSLNTREQSIIFARLEANWIM